MIGKTCDINDEHGFRTSHTTCGRLSRNVVGPGRARWITQPGLRPQNVAILVLPNMLGDYATWGPFQSAARPFMALN